MCIKLILPTLIICINNLTFSQTKEKLEDDKHIYWQPNLNLNLRDFEFDAKEDEEGQKYCKDFNLCVCAATNINLIIDAPINKKKRNKLREKVYIAPVFDKFMSYAITKDTMGVKQQKLVFDVGEWAARYMRQEIQKLKAQFKDKDVSATWYKVILNEALDKKQKIINEFTLDIYINPKVNAYNDWKIKVDKMLDELKDFATSEQECKRFISKKIIDEGYEQSLFLGCTNHN